MDAPPDEPLPSYRARDLLARIAPYYLAHRKALLLALALLLGVIALGLLAPLLLGQVIDLATGQGRPAGRPLWLPAPPGTPGLVLVSLAFVGAVLLGFALEAALGLSMARVGISMVIRLKEDLFRHVLTLDPAFFADMPPGRLIARVESDTEALKQLFSVTALQLLRALFAFVSIFGCMLLFDAETTLLLAPGLLVLTLLLATYLRFVRSYFHRSRRLLAEITGHITEYVQGIEVVRLHDYAPQAEARLRRLQEERYRTDVLADFLNYGFWGLFGAAEVGAATLVLWVGTAKVAAGAMTVGTLVVFLEYLRQVFLPIQMFSEFAAQVQRGFVAAARIFGILGADPAPYEQPDADLDASLREELRFEDVSFEYRPGRPVLRGVSFAVRRGQQVALVGPSGGGKSTIAKLLLRYHAPSAGRITLDGRDLRAVRRSAWRERLGFVPQEVFLFPGTLGDNVSVFDRGRRPAELEEACRAARAGRLLEALPGGLAAELAERGDDLSHGERQLLSLARALARDPELLVLDEATSSVDPETEAAIQASLERLLAGRTAVIVAHRLSTIRRCDRIVVVEGGQVVEQGTHEELWARGGAYRALAELQLGAEDQEPEEPRPGEPQPEEPAAAGGMAS
ncbi:MAG: ABC transporter ATP-binding protein [Planctomycetota bacterium]